MQPRGTLNILKTGRPPHTRTPRQDERSANVVGGAASSETRTHVSVSCRLVFLLVVAAARAPQLDEVVGNQEAVETLRGHVESRVLTPLLLVGPPGVGKTSCAHILARAHLREALETTGVAVCTVLKELNASDDRGIAAAREVQEFAATCVYLPRGVSKIVILDEVDNMTDDAQEMIRRVMSRAPAGVCNEDGLLPSPTTFLLCCNDQARVVPSLQERCSVVPFSACGAKELEDHLVRVTESEGGSLERDASRIIVRQSKGDIRSAVNELAVLLLTSPTNEAGGAVITTEAVAQRFHVPSAEMCSAMLMAVFETNMVAAADIATKLLSEFAPTDIAEQCILVLETTAAGGKPGHRHASAMFRLAELCKRLQEGCSTSLQLLGALGKICTLEAWD